MLVPGLVSLTGTKAMLSDIFPFPKPAAISSPLWNEVSRDQHRFLSRQSSRAQAPDGDVLRLHVCPFTVEDGILVGDSAAMVMHGYPSTLSASVE